jgi:hypothetical protein
MEVKSYISCRVVNRTNPKLIAISVRRGEPEDIAGPDDANAYGATRVYISFVALWHRKNMKYMAGFVDHVGCYLMDNLRFRPTQESRVAPRHHCCLPAMYLQGKYL